MKNIVIIIQQARLDAVKKRLVDAGVCGMTVSPAEGFGYEKKQMKLGKAQEMTVELAPRVRIEIAVRDTEAEAVIKAAMEEARTGRLGDGKIFVSELADVIRIRTGERGDSAL